MSKPIENFENPRLSIVLIRYEKDLLSIGIILVCYAFLVLFQIQLRQDNIFIQKDENAKLVSIAWIVVTRFCQNHLLMFGSSVKS